MQSKDFQAAMFLFLETQHNTEQRSAFKPPDASGDSGLDLGDLEMETDLFLMLPMPVSSTRQLGDEDLINPPSPTVRSLWLHLSKSGNRFQCSVYRISKEKARE